jgi:hypothetical protein
VQCRYEMSPQEILTIDNRVPVFHWMGRTLTPAPMSRLDMAE